MNKRRLLISSIGLIKTLFFIKLSIANGSEPCTCKHIAAIKIAIAVEEFNLAQYSALAAQLRKDLETAKSKSKGRYRREDEQNADLIYQKWLKAQAQAVGQKTNSEAIVVHNTRGTPSKEDLEKLHAASPCSDDYESALAHENFHVERTTEMQTALNKELNDADQARSEAIKSGKKVPSYLEIIKEADTYFTREQAKWLTNAATAEEEVLAYQISLPILKRALDRLKGKCGYKFTTGPAKCVIDFKTWQPPVNWVRIAYRKYEATVCGDPATDVWRGTWVGTASDAPGVTWPFPIITNCLRPGEATSKNIDNEFTCSFVDDHIEIKPFFNFYKCNTKDEKIIAPVEFSPEACSK